MKRIVPTGLMVILITMGCIGPSDLFDKEEPDEEPFEYDLTLEDMWNDIPLNQTSTTDILRLTYELERSPRVTNLTEIGYSINKQPLLLIEFGDYDPTVPTVYFVAAQHGNEPASVDSAYLLARHFARATVDEIEPVSYTHLTLPTICSV